MTSPQAITRQTRPVPRLHVIVEHLPRAESNPANFTSLLLVRGILFIISLDFSNKSAALLLQQSVLVNLPLLRMRLSPVPGHGLVLGKFLLAIRAGGGTAK